MPPEIVIIAAMAANRVIGRDNAIPWHFPEELQWFKATTMGHALIMGRKTHESIGRPLPGRTTIVISRNPGHFCPGCVAVPSLDAALRRCTKETRVFIAGGAQVYADALAIADTIFLTILEIEVAGDTFFPAINGKDFLETNRVTVAGTIPSTRLTYQRRTGTTVRV